MNRTLRRARGSALFLTILLSALGAAPAAAQTPAPPVFVAIPETFPAIDARAIVVRERGRDVVVLRAAEATVEALDMSLAVLHQAHERNPSPRLGEMIPLMGFLPREIPDQRRALLSSTLDALERQPVSSIGTLGSGRWVPLRQR